MNIRIFAVIGLLISLVYFAQADGNPDMEKSSETAVVKNYNDFLKYAENAEQAAIKSGQLPIRKPGQTLKYEPAGLEFSDEKVCGLNKEHRMWGCLSSDGKGMIIIDSTHTKVMIADNSGKIVREGKLPKADDNPSAFSDTRLYALGGMIDDSGGIYVYDYDGNLLKRSNQGFYAECLTISNNQKYFAVSGGSSEASNYFILFDINGNELWRKSTVDGGNAEIKFTRDDRYVVLKLPMYWVPNKTTIGDKQVRKYRKLYVIDISERKIISEEDY